MRKIKQFKLVENGFIMNANQMKEVTGGLTNASEEKYLMFCKCKDSVFAWEQYLKYEMCTQFFYSAAMCSTGSHADSRAIKQ